MMMIIIILNSGAKLSRILVLGGGGVQDWEVGDRNGQENCLSIEGVHYTSDRIYRNTSKY